MFMVGRKFEVHARHVAGISTALDMGQNGMVNKVAERETLIQLVVFVLSFEGIGSRGGGLEPGGHVDSSGGLSCRISPTTVQPSSCGGIAATVLLSLTIHTLVNTHADTLPVLTGMLPHTGVASGWFSILFTKGTRYWHMTQCLDRPTLSVFFTRL